MERRSTFVAAAIVVLGVAPTRNPPAPPPARAPRIVLVAEPEEDDSSVSLSALRDLLAERHGMTTTRARSHSAEIGRDGDPLANADVAVVFERFRTASPAEQRGLDALLARGGGLVVLRAPGDAAKDELRPDGGRTVALPLGRAADFEDAAFRRALVNAVERVLGRKSSDSPDVELPETTPLTNFEVSTAYASDWTKPIAAQVFPPEEGIGGFNDVQWIPVKSEDGALDLRRFDPTSKQGTIYVKSKVAVKGKRDLELVLQSDDGLEVFVDGKKRASSQVVRTLRSGCDVVPVTLDDGEHELMLKVMNAGDAWAVRARVRDLTAYRAGKPK